MMYTYLKKSFSLNNAIWYCTFFLGISFLFGKLNGNIPVNTKTGFAGIPFLKVQSGESNHRFIWMHGDEKTAKMVLEDYLDFQPGIGFFIQCDEREVPFYDTKVDPNRIFSTNGSKMALKKFKPSWDQNNFNRALSELEKGRQSFLNELFPINNGVLVALHNNFRGYNVYSETNNSTNVSIKKNQNPRDFIICTNENDYKILASGPYNVVLQNEKVGDDGSLSWASLDRGIRYINIEVRLGWRSQQIKMLQFVHDTLLLESK